MPPHELTPAAVAAPLLLLLLLVVPPPSTSAFQRQPQLPLRVQHRYRRRTQRRLPGDRSSSSTERRSSAAADADAASASPPLPRRARPIAARRRRKRSKTQIITTSTAAKAKATTISRPLVPPFPNGPCGGTLVTIPPEQTYKYGPDDNVILTTLAGAGGNLVGSISSGGGGGNDDSSSSSSSVARGNAGSGDTATSTSNNNNPIFLPPRSIDVWLPPTYDVSGTRRHPVLLCHDGQNAIDDESSWTGSSWRLAGALTRLAERDLLDSSHLCSSGGSSEEVDPIPIVVMLPSAEGDLLPGVRRRHLEYGDPSIPIARAHADFVATTVLPLIHSRFRTVRDDPRGTSAIGSSLGGQAAFHLLLRYPTLFGGAAALSPAFQPSTITAAVTADAETLRAKRIYIDNGGDLDSTKVPWFDFMDHVTPKHWWNPGYFWLDTQLQPGIDAMRTALDLLGVPYEYRKVPGGRHNERAWAQRIDAPLLHLYGRRGQKLQIV